MGVAVAEVSAPVNRTHRQDTDVALWQQRVETIQEHLSTLEGFQERQEGKVSSLQRQVEERAQALEEVRSLLRAEREQHRALLPDVQNALSQVRSCMQQTLTSAERLRWRGKEEDNSPQSRSPRAQ